MQSKHSVFAINLKERPDRLGHIQNEFKHRDEFKFQVISTSRNKNGAFGLWKNIVKVIKRAQKENHEYVIICEDDHQFTKKYTGKFLQDRIIEAQQKNADVLMGGVSWFKSALQISTNLVWVDLFSGLQFTVIYKKFFDIILDVEFRVGDAADYKISKLTSNKLVIYPFISTQKEFGYSDATPKNNLKGPVEFYFKKTPMVLRQLIRVKKHYESIPKFEIMLEDEYDKLTIPTYVINLPERTERLEHIKNEFKGKNEFDITIVEACKHKIGAVGLWHSIIKVINLAIKNEDDVIIICEDDHKFTDFYNKNNLLRNIIDASNLGADLLSGGIGGFDQTVPIANSKYWINTFYCTQFLVLYKNIFPKVLDVAFDEKDTADGVFSEMTSNKMVIYPFISIQKGFGYSDVTQHNEVVGAIDRFFNDTMKRFDTFHGAYLQYHPINT